MYASERRKVLPALCCPAAHLHQVVLACFETSKDLASVCLTSLSLAPFFSARLHFHYLPSLLLSQSLLPICTPPPPTWPADSKYYFRTCLSIKELVTLTASALTAGLLLAISKKAGKEQHKLPFRATIYFQLYLEAPFVCLF